MSKTAMSKELSLRLFGPPPLLEGEDPAGFDELVGRVFDAIAPTDFIEMIWARDLVDITWTIFWMRRIEAAYLTARMPEDVRTDAAWLAEAKTEQLEGSEKVEMNRLMDGTSGLSWEARSAENPRAREKFEKLCASAMNEIQAKVVVREFGKIESIEHMIFIKERRFDEIIREIDRHRDTRKQRGSVQVIEEAEFKTV
jgi:hypothetical protein